MSALSKDPRGIRLSPGVYRNPKTGKTYNSANGALGRDPRVSRRPKQIEGAPAQVPNIDGAQAQNPTFSEETYEQAMQRGFENFGNMGQFNPNLGPLPEMPGGDYSAMRQKAEQVAMESFDRNMGPQQEREEAAFRQRMAEQGVPETSEAYQRQYSDLKNQQNAARQNAMTSAFQAGQGEQAQAYGQQAQNYQLGMANRGQQFDQGIQQYRLPMEQLNALSPYYNINFQQQDAERQRAWQEQMARQQNKWDRQNMRLQYNLSHSGRGGGGGGGGGNPAGMWDRSFDQMAMGMFGQPQQQNPQYPGYAGGFLQGFAQGTPMGLFSGLKGGS